MVTGRRAARTPLIMRSLLLSALPLAGAALALVLGSCSSGGSADTVASSATTPTMNTKTKKASFAAG